MYYENLLQNYHIDGLMQERRNSIANALELRLFALTHRIISNVLFNGDMIIVQIMY